MCAHVNTVWGKVVSDGALFAGGTGVDFEAGGAVGECPLGLAVALAGAALEVAPHSIVEGIVVAADGLFGAIFNAKGAKEARGTLDATRFLESAGARHSQTQSGKEPETLIPRPLQLTLG